MPKVRVNSDEFYMDGYLKSNLDDIKIAVRNDWDMVIVVDGYEGSGKSRFTQQVAYYCDPTFNLDDITFTPESFTNRIKTCDKFKSVIFDEAYGGLSSRAALSKVNRAIVKVLTEIRQKNLFVFIVLPSFFDLDRYVAIHRSRALLHIYTGENLERGYFKFFNMDNKKGLYLTGKKFYSYKGRKPNFFGRFPKFTPIDEQAYDAKKLKATTEGEEESPENKKEAILNERARIAHRLREHFNLTNPQIGLAMDVSRWTITDYIKRAEELGLE